MKLLPAIDLLGGNCVRLFRGDFDTAHQVADDPLSTARSFQKAGAGWIHMVDLDGARTGDGINRPVILQVAQNTSLKVEVGGGIRSMDAIDTYLQGGVSRVILGSAALEDPPLVKKAVEQYGQRIAVGIDAKNGQVAARGWLSTSSVDYLTLAKQMENLGVSTIIFTDIAKDGMMLGPNFEQMKALRQAVSCDLVASGGIRSLEDLQQLQDIGIDWAILGKSIYQGAIDLAKALKWAKTTE
ncbi:MAG: 1-(5-phosphoribosyl)-5-[Oscillospiraceae bacterium]|nr:1-(5-phosphoribosyl)-5-[(5-phosphoribosylamino)methylideneamino]imidazole-4-carboxamide isomerase [Oscillospiraceae bacterium]